MKRRAVNLLSVLSLLIVLATAVIWVRSAFVADYLVCERPGVRDTGRPPEWPYRAVGWDDGLLLIYISRLEVSPDPDPNRQPWKFRRLFYEPGDRIEDGGDGDLRSGGGFHYSSHKSSDSAFRVTVLTTPLWFPMLIGLLLPVGIIMKWVRSRRRGKEGLCRRCGYDLRATTERCPECGELVPALGAGLGNVYGRPPVRVTDDMGRGNR